MSETPNSKVVSNVPEWLQSELFKDILKANIPNYRQIKSFRAESGSSAGENYATIMLRVEVEVELNDGTFKQLSYMLKLPHQHEMFLKMLETNNVFDIELGMYKDIVAEFEQMYKDVGVEVKFGAQCFEIDAPSYYLLLEDLRMKGFKNANRLDCLDMEHTQLALHKLSQWHAASAVRVATKGIYDEKFMKGFFYSEENKDMLHQASQPMRKQFLISCETYDGHEAYIDDIKAIQPVLTDTYVSLNKTDPDEFNVLNHGDFWCNNIMFQYDENNKVKETYLIDYQLPKYGSPAQDLLYFLLSSTKLEDKLSKFDYYIKYYHDHLVENLKLLNYSKKIPTLKDLHTTLFKYGTWGFWTATGVMGAVLLDPTESAKMENFMSESEEATNLKKQIFTNPRYRKHIEAILPWLQNRGAFEFNEIY